MTREKAIEYGKLQLEIFGGEHKEFIEIAIKALEQESILNKVRAEIEQHRRKTQSIDNYDLVGDCLDILDKYKKSEG